MEKNIYYERQCAVIESAKQAESMREMLRTYHREKASREAYFRIMETKRYKVVRDCKTKRGPKKPSTAIEHGVRPSMRTKRFSNSHITVCYKHMGI